MRNGLWLDCLGYRLATITDVVSSWRGTKVGMVPKAEGFSIWGREGGWMGDSPREQLSSPLASQWERWRRRSCFLFSSICFLSLIVSCNLGKSLGESLRESLGKSLRWVLLSVPYWTLGSRGSDSGGSLRLSRSYRVCRSKGLEAVVRLPAARPLRRVGSARGCIDKILRKIFSSNKIFKYESCSWRCAE